MQSITQKVSTPDLIYMARHDKMQMQDKGYNSESYSFGVISVLNLNILVV